MAMETRLQMKLTQKLVMSQNLQLAIKLLQMTKMELEEVVSQEILENPVLEIVEGEPARDEMSETNADLPTVSQIREEGSPAEKEELAKLQQNERVLNEVEWEMLLDDNPDEIGFNTREDRDPVNYENFIKSEEPSLYEHLVWQLSMASESPETIQAAMEIIAAINQDGYLTTRLEDIAQRTNIPLSVLEDALDLVQTFEPPKDQYQQRAHPVR